jgi:hypothetical protein
MQIILQLQLFPQTRRITRLPEGEERSKHRRGHKTAEAAVESVSLDREEKKQIQSLQKYPEHPRRT